MPRRVRECHAATPSRPLYHDPSRRPAINSALSGATLRSDVSPSPRRIPRAPEHVQVPSGAQLSARGGVADQPSRGQRRALAHEGDSMCAGHSETAASGLHEHELRGHHLRVGLLLLGADDAAMTGAGDQLASPRVKGADRSGVRGERQRSGHRHQHAPPHSGCGMCGPRSLHAGRMVAARNERQPTAWPV